MSWPSPAEFRALVLATPCFRCGARVEQPCRAPASLNRPIHSRPHQARLDIFWEQHQGVYRLPANLRLSSKRGEQGGVWE